MQSIMPRGGDSLPPASSVDARRCVEVHGRVESQEVEAHEQTTQVTFPLIAARAGDHLHDHGFRHRNSVVAGDELREAFVDRAASRPVVLHPRRGVDEDHGASAGVTSLGIWSIACAPRIANASSRVIG